MRDAELLKRAKAMRREMTEPETRLWLALRAKRFDNIAFRRQKPIGPYIADFAARDPMLVIEVDGDTHAHRVDDDTRRTTYLNEQGYRVLRFSNSDVMANVEGVLAAIAAAVGDGGEPAALPLSQPSPLKGRGL